MLEFENVRGLSIIVENPELSRLANVLERLHLYYIRPSTAVKNE